MSDDKECGGGGNNGDGQRVKHILMAIGGFLVVVGIVVFLVWAILQPHKPSFTLQDVTIYAFNHSEPDTLTSNMQVTLVSHNPNEKIGIYYQKLDVFASYENQQITLPTLLPSSYQGHLDDTVWSPFLFGDAVPVGPFIGQGLSQDLNTGMVLLNIRVYGQLKWRVGTWISGRYQINANCPAYIAISDPTKGVQVGSAIKYQLVQTCTVAVSLN